MKTAVVKKDDLSIATIYDGNSNQSYYGGPLGKPAKYAHVEYDDSLGIHIKAQDDGEGGIEIVQDIQPSRNAKLILMRSIRNSKLKEVDIMCNELAVEARSDVTAIREYRQELLDITNAFKDPEDENVGLDGLDPLEKDLSNFSWPDKP